MTRKELAAICVQRLKEEYPEAECSLEYKDPLQLLVSVRLAAQCTDARVNMVMPALVERFPTLDAWCEGTEEEIAELIKSCGLYKSKARDLYKMVRVLKNDLGGVIPDTVEELCKLPGVGRKTANLIVGDVFGKPAIVTDTHCIRICGLLGLTDNKEPYKVEKDLWACLDPEEGNDFCHRLVLHGRAVCVARRPKCDECCMKDVCRHATNSELEERILP
ncbi:MAG: endonuclease III [Clostridia bacterium]|nr:endonuclease III [Clostridia bacterium]